ncbi:hypothetical protein OXB_2480 [Bacillus sp. OxB-1]|uniref:hypothetical protein n=1 Tax=Bacillus sp. (strain OxB-1) TaxID=98228 RepID=UPI000581F3CD|nr:hypothetical protein [Bacillus sp. OxB-1]BAQ10951.1 hypothetical protein OXB_2480 [Bacillus sp. OxB-1]
MSEKLLQQILAELKDVKTEMKDFKFELNEIKSKVDDNTKKLETLDELKEITLALRDRQEETDARLESLAMDVHKMQGNVTDIKEQLADIRSELEFTYQKTAKNEMELFKLKRDFD